MEIKLPSMPKQQRIVEIMTGIEESAMQILANRLAPHFPGQSEFDESYYSAAHLLPELEGWEAPSADIVGAYFRQFQSIFSEYGSDAKLAKLLGLSSDRRIREYKQGVAKVPYGVWRKFLVMTGRVAQEPIHVFGFFGAADEMPQKHSYQVNPRTKSGKLIGYDLKMFEWGSEVGSGYFPVEKNAANYESACTDAFNAAENEGVTWLNSRI